MLKSIALTIYNAFMWLLGYNQYAVMLTFYTRNKEAIPLEFNQISVIGIGNNKFNQITFVSRIWDTDLEMFNNMCHMAGGKYHTMHETQQMFPFIKNFKFEVDDNTQIYVLVKTKLLWSPNAKFNT